jgi:hypothetical protein
VRAAIGRPRLLRPSAATSALIGIDGLMSMWQVVLNVGLPLWILQATAASPAVVAVLYAINTVVAVALQARVSRAVGTYAAAVRAQGLASLEDVAAVVLETNGTFSVVRRGSEGMPSALRDLPGEPA